MMLVIKAIRRMLFMLQLLLLGQKFTKITSHGAASVTPSANLKLRISVDDTEPLFQGNTTKVYVNISHTEQSLSNAIHVVLTLQASFDATFSLVEVSADSVGPNLVLQNTLKFDRLDRMDTFFGELNMTVDPARLATPGHVHVGHVFVRMTYDDELNSCTVGKSTDTTQTSFYFYAQAVSSCIQPLGMKSGRIKESQVLASSFYKESNDSLGQSPHQARLGGEGYWSPASGNASADQEQFLQIHFETPIYLKMIILQGKPNSKARVRDFDVMTSLDGMNWRKEQQKNPKAAIVIRNGDASVPTAYQSPVATQFLRLKPRKWYEESAVRLEVYGCIQSAEVQEEDFPALGLEGGAISDVQMTASSAYDPITTSAANGRLNFNDGWCSAASEQPLYLQVDLVEMHVVTAISSQSRNTKNNVFASVTSYSLSHSEDGVTWDIYQQNGADKIFLGNLVEHLITKHHLTIPIKTRLVRFLPLGMISLVCMRIELYGAKSTEENTDKPPFYQRSFLLDVEHQRLFICHSKILSAKPSCYMRQYIQEEQWRAMDRRIVSLLGYDTMEDIVYGVGTNRKSYLRCSVNKCYSVHKDSWLKIRSLNSTVLATEITFVPETGHNLTDQHIPVFDLIDAEGNTWGASAVGIHFYRPGEGSWKLKAKWQIHGLDHCLSSPCENGGSCVGGERGYTCLCKREWTGRNCESELCTKKCLNGGSCEKDWEGKPTCKCTTGFLGRNCKQGCTAPGVGLKSGGSIGGNRFSSKTYEGVYKPEHGRLMGSLAWCPSSSSSSGAEYLQVDLGSFHSLCALATQGNSEGSDWTTFYRVTFKDMRGTWKNIKENSVVKLFVGNIDQRTVVKNILPRMVVTRYLKIFPVRWHNRACVRLEAYGRGRQCGNVDPADRITCGWAGISESQCQENGCCFDSSISEVAWCFKPTEIPVTNSLGAQTKGSLPDSSFTASREYDAAVVFAPKGRLYGPRAWCPPSAANIPHEYLQVDLGGPSNVWAVATQSDSAFDYRAEEYKVMYSRDGTTWAYVTESGFLKIFQGNFNQNTPRVTALFSSIAAQYVRFNPTKNTGLPCMRVDLYGEGCYGREIIPLYTASTESDVEHNASKADPRSPGAWCPRKSFHGYEADYLQMKLNASTLICAVSIAGDKDGNSWVRSFIVSVSLDGKQWKNIQENGKDKVFAGVKDESAVDAKTKIALPNRVRTRYLRLSPLKYQTLPCLKASVYEAADCPKNWTEYQSSCYKAFEKNEKSMSTAKSSCEQEGGYLVKITSSNENAFVYHLTRTHASTMMVLWVGLERGSGGEFAWQDGTSAAYGNWKSGEPNDYGGREDCVAMITNPTSGYRMTWNDISCVYTGQIIGYVCEQPPKMPR